jgi:DNA-binding XRE family transcriptional regulator
MDAPPKNDEKDAEKEAKAGASAKPAHPKKVKNNVRKIRMERMMSKAELARRAGLSTLTVDRVERGMPCRMDTKRKILEAMGLQPSDRVMVFGDSEED